MTTLVHGPITARRKPGLRVLVAIGALTLAVGYSAAVAGRVPLSRDADQTRALSAMGAAVPLTIGDWLATVRPDGPRSTIEFSSLSTGQHLATLNAGFSTMAVTRRSANQILVSDVIADAPNGAGAPHPRLWILDGRSLSVEAGPVPMPGRAMYTLYATAMTLSANERYLFYLRRTECGPGCDDYSVAVLDLNNRSEIAEAKLPRNCGYAELSKAGSGVIALCPEFASLWRIDSAGTSIELAAFNILNDHPIHGGVTARGESFMVTQKGRLLVKDDRGALLVDRVLVDEPLRFSGLHRLSLTPTHDALGVKASADVGLAGVLYLDRTAWTARLMNLPIGVTHLADTGDGSVAVIGSGRAMLVSATSELLKPLPLDIASTTEWSFASGTN